MTATTKDQRVKCCRCRNKHTMGERKPVPDKHFDFVTNLACPRCGAHGYQPLDD